MALLIQIIRVISQILSLLVLIQVLLSYVMSPYHPVRQTLDSIIEPLLAPIRRLVPPAGMFDFSPIILMVLIQLITQLLVGFLSAY